MNTPNPAHEQAVVADVRRIIDQAKADSAKRAAQPVEIQLNQSEHIELKPQRTRGSAAHPTVDPSNVKVPADPRTTALLIARLIELRDADKVSAIEQDAIKAILLVEAGDLEYIALEEGADPVLALKFESSVRVNTDAVKEQFPPSEYTDLYKQTSSRPVKVL